MPNADYYEEQMAVYSELSIKENDTLCTWFRHILFVATTLLGILISLHDMSNAPQYTRLCLALAEILLSIGIVSAFAVLYRLSLHQARVLRSAYRDELLNAQKENRTMRIVGDNIPRCYTSLETLAYPCFGLSFFLLSVYSLLCVFQ